jgi:signal peptidase I
MRRLGETAVCVTLGLVLVGTWLVEPYSVVSGSMHPTLLGPHREFDCAVCDRHALLAADVDPMPDRAAFCPHCKSGGPIEDRLPVVPGDALLVDRRAFWFRAPRRWEVIAFRLPAEAAKVAVKRIAGLPGETVELVGGRVWIDGAPATDAPPHLDYTPPRWRHGPVRWKLGPDEYFVLGDNPVLSDDSRTWTGGPGVATQQVVGKPFMVHAPRRLWTVAGRPFNVPDVSAIRYIH